MFNFIKRAIFLGGLAAIIVAVFVAGIFLGYSQRPEVSKITGLFSKEPPSQFSNLDFNPFWEVWNIIESKYVSKNKIQRQEMLWGAIGGLVASLDDPYSVFFPPQEAEIFESTVRGDFQGVGMEIGMRNKILTVIAPLKNSPAEKAGIKAGDQIVKIDDTITADLSIEKAVSLIRGEKGTKVTLQLLREDGDEPLQIEVTREVIELPILDIERKDGGIFVIKLYNFSGRSDDEFRTALRKFVEAGDSKLVIDLRGNTGGYLDSSIKIARWFLPIGKEVVKEEFADGSEEVYRSEGPGIFKDLPTVILIDKGSASASEILAGALKDHGIATLVGEQSYGKGSVQQLFNLDQKSSLKLTIARWLTPSGKSISEEGLEPDFKIELTGDDKTDKQMEKAIEILSKK